MLYHTISELITILIGLFIIVILVRMKKHIQSNRLIFIICISVFFTGIVDIFHILAYPGLNYFSSASEPEVVTVFLEHFDEITTVRYDK